MDIARKLEYDKTYMRMADVLAQLSYAKRSKVGCLIVSEDGQIVSQGYNGMPHGMDNCCETIKCSTDFCKCIEKANCDENCIYAKMVTKPEVLHAESNAISKCAKWNSSTDGATCYVTLSPCVECAKLMIQSGIKRVCYKDLYRDTNGIKLLSQAGIKVEKIEI